MPSMQEWEKSQRLTENLRSAIIKSSIRFCFEPLSKIFEELYIVLAWDLYHIQTPASIIALYAENKEIMAHLVDESCIFAVAGIGGIPSFESYNSNIYQNKTPEFPFPLPLLNNKGRRYSSHQLNAPVEGANKKERALYKRYDQLGKDIVIFTGKVAKFSKELRVALDSCASTKQFNEQNPEFEGYMKQSLKKFYNSAHPNVIESLNSAMNVRAYASLTSGHRLQAYQTTMLEQLEQLPARITIPSALT